MSLSAITPAVNQFQHMWSEQHFSAPPVNLVTALSGNDEIPIWPTYTQGSALSGKVKRKTKVVCRPDQGLTVQLPNSTYSQLFRLQVLSLTPKHFPLTPKSKRLSTNHQSCWSLLHTLLGSAVSSMMQTNTVLPSPGGDYQCFFFRGS